MLNCPQIIAEDVAAVIIYCGQAPPAATPGHPLPAFPDSAATNHDANGDHILYETREFWGRLQPASLVPLLQAHSSKGKGRMPSSLLQSQRASSRRGTFHPGDGSADHDFGPRDSSSGSRDGILLTSCSHSSRVEHDTGGSAHSSRDATSGTRTVHFDLPSSSSDSSSGDDSFPPHAEASKGSRVESASASGSQSLAEARMKKTSPPIDISFRWCFCSGPLPGVPKLLNNRCLIFLQRMC